MANEAILGYLQSLADHGEKIPRENSFLTSIKIHNSEGKFCKDKSFKYASAQKYNF